MMNFIGDWLTPKGSYSGNTPTAQILNCVHLVYQLQVASKIAAALGRTADATSYSARADAVAKATHQRFYNPESHAYGNGDSACRSSRSWWVWCPRTADGCPERAET